MGRLSTLQCHMSAVLKSRLAELLFTPPYFEFPRGWNPGSQITINRIVGFVVKLEILFSSSQDNPRIFSHTAPE